MTAHRMQFPAVPGKTPRERLENLARLIFAVPKAEVKDIDKQRPKKRRIKGVTVGAFALLIGTGTLLGALLSGCTAQGTPQESQFDMFMRQADAAQRQQDQAWAQLRADTDAQFERETREAAQQHEEYAAKAARHIYCRDGKDCRTKWGRAVGWVSTHSSWKIQTQTEALIQTFGPDSSEAYGYHMAFTVNKIPLNDGRSEIVMSLADCGRSPCDFETNVAKALFADFLSGKPR